MKVDFIIPGAQKSGTSALMNFLSQNPEVGIPLKEIHFFLQRTTNHKSGLDYNQYHEHFKNLENKKVIGQKGPNYLPRLETASHMYHYNPNLKFIILLRNPCLRAFSQFNMRYHVLKNEKISSFSKLIRLEADLLSSGTNEAYYKALKRYGYISRGLYCKQIAAYINFFNKNNFLILLNEDLKNNHTKTITRINNFLGVVNFVPNKQVIGSFNYENGISDDDYNFLLKYFYEDIIQLQDLVERDLSTWLN